MLFTFYPAVVGFFFLNYTFDFFVVVRVII